MVDYNFEFARGGAFFTAELFEILSENDGKQNIVFSPFSIQTCMALAFAGAQGETADEIVKGLHFISNLPPQVANAFQCVLKKYKNSRQLKIANRLYVQEDKMLRSSYKAIIKEQYYSKAKSINFALSDAAAQSINVWVNTQTNGKITELVSADRFDEQTRLVLLNAIHFKGKWLHDFMEKDTMEDDFWVNEEESIKVHYMYQEEHFGYADFPNLECIALDMPYKKSDLSMFVLLPQKREGLKALVEKLKTVNLVDLADKLVKRKVQVNIPKFKVDYSIELTDTLKQLGIKKMFSDGAEFSNLLKSPEGFYVSNVLHKAIIEVNEEGTEAAAATTMEWVNLCYIPSLSFRADHPFLYFIWNKKNILFAGAFVNANA